MRILFILALLVASFTYGRAQDATDSYFQFDQVNHFKMTDKKKLNDVNYIFKDDPEEKKILHHILLERKSIFGDTTFIKKAESLGFIKIDLNQTKVEELKKIFSPKEFDRSRTTFCDPVYNDLLIFRFKNSIVGFAKICFGCGKMVIVGKNVTENFEAPTDSFNALETLLKIQD